LGTDPVGVDPEGRAGTRLARPLLGYDRGIPGHGPADGIMRRRTEQAIELMMGFAERTGLTAARPHQRYLWTDAFAVCNFLGLAHVTGEPRFTELALQLVHHVHQVLGRHRAEDRRTGWISGLTDEQAGAHPTRGGLRIGKPLPERRPGEPFDERLEWERDGQYFHYLTKWMHALDQVTRATGQTMFNRWARELAHAAHRAFTYVPGYGTGKRMYWKMSVDLARPLVESMGQHDPLDGLVTYTQLEATVAGAGPPLDDAITDFEAMVDPRGLATQDPLGLGGLLGDAFRLMQLEQHGASGRGLVEPLLAAALEGLRHYVEQPDLRMPAGRRLAFRELGLAIGLAAMEADAWRRASPGVHARVDRLSRYLSLRAEIEAFWLQPEHHREGSWVEHASINEVMLAASLLPEGFLVLAPVRAS
jgi:hypothetical protein